MKGRVIRGVRGRVISGVRDRVISGVRGRVIRGVRGRVINSVGAQQLAHLTYHSSFPGKANVEASPENLKRSISYLGAGAGEDVV